MKNAVKVFAIGLILILGCLAAAAQQTPPTESKAQQAPGTTVQPAPPAKTTITPPPPQPLPVRPQISGSPAAPPATDKPATPPTGDQPKIVVKEMEFDAGKVIKGDQIKHEFIVENQGKATLEITKVQPACGCTVASYDQKIEPGKTGKISTTVATAGFSGPIHKTISVATNDTLMANFQLAIKAEVKSILNVEPSENQQFGLVFKGQTMEKEFSIKSDDGSPFQINSIQAEDINLKYEIKPAADKKSATFKVILPADHPVGPITGRFTLSTTHPKVPTLNLNVFGTIRDPLTVYPTEISFSGLNKAWIDEHPDDASLNKTITLSYDQAPELEIKSATSNLKELEVTTQTLEEKKRFSIKVALKPPLKVGDFTGEVKIETNMKTLTIPVKGKIF
jgi:hypothetical protein